MCKRPSITYFCCSHTILWLEGGDRYVDQKWQPPIVERCSRDDKDTPLHLVLYLDYGTTWWSIFPVACADCEEKVIRTQQSEEDVRARIDARLKRFSKTSSCMEPAARARVLRFSKIFFRSAFKKRLDQVEALYNELYEMRQGLKGVGQEEIVLTELRLDNAWRELYEFMELPLSPDAPTSGGTE